MLRSAQRRLEQCLSVLKPELDAGTPIVVLEPSCAAVFRDELPNLFPGNVDAQRLAQQTFVLSEFLAKKMPDYRVPELRASAVVHGHCHQKAVIGFRHDQELLEKVCLDAEILDAGCCGLAGSFGYETAHYEVSMNSGERVLFPKVRAASDDCLVVADGFSCRSQIRHGTERRALHSAQVLKLAMSFGHGGLVGRPGRHGRPRGAQPGATSRRPAAGSGRVRARRSCSAVVLRRITACGAGRRARKVGRRTLSPGIVKPKVLARTYCKILTKRFSAAFSAIFC
jgi:hypothetical protein